MNNIIDNQTGILLNYLKYAANTDYGRLYNFQSIKSYEQFIEKVPVSDFNSYNPYKERLKRGEADLVWPGSANEFAISAGTTGEPKIIPIFKERKQSDRRFLRQVAFSYLRRYPDFIKLLGKQITLPGMVENWPDYPRATFGEISGLLALNAPYIFTRQQLIPANESVWMSFQDKVEKNIELGVKEDVRVFTSLPSVALRFFQQLLEKTGKQSIAEIWPNLQAIITGGEPLKSYKAHIKKLSEGINPRFVENYGASEGYFAFNTEQDRDDLKMVVDNNVFYEWIPDPSENRDELKKQKPIPTWQVETGKRYAMVVTSDSGLWRYLLNDVILFTDLETPRIRVTGRVSDVLDDYGETIESIHIQQTLEKVTGELGGIYSNWCVGVLLNDDYTTPTHIWFIEWAEKPVNTEAFVKAVDETLISINRSYEIRRKGGAISEPKFYNLNRRAIEQWQKELFKVKAQSKTPRMIHNQEICLSLMNKCEPLLRVTHAMQNL
ncbi:MAG: GH3 auxin-responsive promoter family protein [Balneolales bacterium]